MESLLTKKQAGELLGVTTRTSDRLRADGRLRAVRVRRSVRFEPSELQRYIQRTRDQA